MMEDLSIKLLTKRGTITYKAKIHIRATIIDLTIATLNIASSILTCGRNSGADYRLDHVLILTTLDY